MEITDQNCAAYLVWMNAARNYSQAMTAFMGGDDSARLRMPALQRAVTRTYLALLQTTESATTGEHERAKSVLAGRR